MIYDLLVAAMIIPIIHTTLIMKHQNASYFSCVVFLSIVVNHVVDANPYFFAFQQVLDTMIGIAIGVGINSFHLPVKKQKDILFVSGIDDKLIEKNEQLSVYTKRELNYLLEDGVNFTISTMRTPASLQNVLEGVNLRLPIIAMDGAVLYDMKENAFIKTFVISHETTKELLSLIHSYNLHCFSNVIIDDCLLIYYDTLENFYMELQKQGYDRKLKILHYSSQDYPGYSYMKIYNQNASRQNMLEYLKEMTGLTKTITFGSLEHTYDVTVKSGEADKVAKTLKNMYERPIWSKNDEN